ncbi:MAG: UvrD-helicase domain-containing protein, partial [Verrucomicrobiaceae bacterium]|nr:UvrD-helicase domain-containing protein [Verrucomicrobiaceae bacterium]
MATKLLKTPIEFITASAGTGKTYQLVTIVHDAVAKGKARPEGIMATTFTAAAAAELRERLALRFHEQGRHREALLLAEGRIGTVHSVCSGLLTRFAFEAGLPPELRVLEEAEASLLMDRALDEVIDEPTTLALMSLAVRLEQYDPQTRQYAYSKAIRSLVGEARSNDIDFDRLPSMGAASAAEMVSFLPPASDDDLTALLSAALDLALQLMPENPATKGSQTYRGLLVHARRNLGGTHGLKWSEWLKLSTATPTKAELDCTECVRLAASRLQEHPAFRDDLQSYLSQLFEIASRVGDRFQALKRERGVLDFQDLEKETLDLLRTSEACRESLREELDLLVVDEFQDTSPIQLALFSSLAACAKRTVWVGDVKQSIYQFRGADPELIHGAVRGATKLAPLSTSWRSLPDLVSLANSLFSRPFLDRIGLPEAETRVSPHRQSPADAPPCLEVARLSSGVTHKNGNPKSLTNAQIPDLLADLVEDSLRRGDPVVDKASVKPEDPVGRSRPLRAGDIAVLVRSNARALDLAESLRYRGIDVVIGGVGLLQTPECRLALTAYRRLLDPRDSLASAEIITFENRHATEEWLEQRLRFVRDRGPEGAIHETWGIDGDLVSPAICALQHARESRSLDLLSPLQAYDLAASTADLSRIVASWGPSEAHFRQREANLENLRQLIAEYETRSADFGHPATPTGLLAHLDDLAEKGEDKKAVDPETDAVHLSTYHGAKGLEWPVVIAADLDSGLRSRLFSLRSLTTAEVTGSFLDDPLAGRELRLWLCPFGRSKNSFVEAMETSPAGLASQRGAEDEELRLLYVGLTRARDRLILPLEIGKAHPWLELAGLPAQQVLGVEADGVLPLDPDTSLRVRCSQWLPGEAAPPPEPSSTIHFPERATIHTTRPPAILVPSSQEPIPGARVAKVIEFGERLR